MRSPLRDELLEVTGAANAGTRKWRHLIQQYAEETDALKKSNTLALITSTLETTPRLIKEFQRLLEGIADSLFSYLKKVFISLSLFVLLTLGATAHFFNSRLAGSLKKTVEFATALSKGDFHTELKIKSRDELGRMAEALNAMARSLRQMIDGVVNGIGTINASSMDLSTIAAQLSNGSREAATKSNNVQVAIEEMSSSMGSIATAMEQSSSNTRLVAASASQMSSTIGEIAQHSENARVISDQASGQAALAATRVDELGKAAQSIGKVVETITDISEQVNLLAMPPSRPPAPGTAAGGLRSSPMKSKNWQSRRPWPRKIFALRSNTSRSPPRQPFHKWDRSLR
jgi:methyl-accepting chemotaxis protein